MSWGFTVQPSTLSERKFFNLNWSPQTLVATVSLGKQHLQNAHPVAARRYCAMQLPKKSRCYQTSKTANIARIAMYGPSNFVVRALATLWVGKVSGLHCVAIAFRP